jgi:receptor protein-tyrosine kinase
MSDTSPSDKAGSILERAARGPAAEPVATPAAPTAGPAGAAAPATERSLLERASAAGARADAGLQPPAPAPGAPRPVSFAERAAAAGLGTAGGVLRETPRDAARRVSRQGRINLDALAEQGFIVPDAASNLTAEEFRLVKRQLLTKAFARGAGAIKNGNLILIGSALPNEGKTFCAINLAMSVASERDLTVLLVDADFAKPEIVQRMGLDAGPGLIDVVADRSLDLGDCLIRTQIPNLTVLPAGRSHNLVTELLASERMSDIIQEVARRYTDRIVIFDSPPALVSSAASTLAMHVGQVVFVVAAETTRESDLREGLGLMAGCSNIQLLLNRSRFSPGQRRFATYYNYGA